MNKSLLNNQQTSDEKRRALIKWMGESTSGGIQTYEQFLNASSNQRMSQELIGKLEKLKARLEKDNGHTSLDPIRYLMRLYYLKGLTIEEILKKTKEKGLHYKDVRGLSSLFSNVFQWELIESGKDHPLKVERRKSTVQVTKLKEYNNTTAKDNTNVFNQRLLDVLKNKKIFSERELKSFTGKQSEQSNKISYLLECFEGITLKKAIEIGMDADLGARAIKRILDEKLTRIKKEAGIDEKLEASLTNIGKILRKNKALTNHSAHH